MEKKEKVHSLKCETYQGTPQKRLQKIFKLEGNLNFSYSVVEVRRLATRL